MPEEDVGYLAQPGLIALAEPFQIREFLEALSGLRTNRFTGSTGDRGGSSLKSYPETRLVNSSQCAKDQYSQDL